MIRGACVACVIGAALLWPAPAQPQTPGAPPAPQRPAQPPPPTPKTGNPTPGTPQPDPPNVANRIAVIGCLQMAPGAGAAPASAATTPASNRFVLRDVKKDERVPPDASTASAAATPVAPTYRLEALDSQMSPFVNTRVELSGEVKAEAGGPPVLLVEFVRKVAAKCQ